MRNLNRARTLWTSGPVAGNTARLSGFSRKEWTRQLGFEKFGRFGYVSQTKINPLLSYLEKGQIAATKCKKCGRTYFPPRADCLDCRHSTIEWVVLDGKSSLITFTQVFF